MSLREQKIEDARFCFVDTETTGMSPALGARVCEIAVVSGGLSFSSIINPCCVIPDELVGIHGITNDMASRAPKFEAVAPEIINILDGGVIVCHNADFDIPFIAHEFALCGLRLPRAVVLDTLKFARKNGSFKSNRLGNIVEALGFCNEGWHRATADAKMTEKVFNHFLEKFKNAGARTVGDLEDFQVKKIKETV